MSEFITSEEAKAWRHKHKKTHREMGDLIGISHVAYGNFENGITKKLRDENAIALGSYIRSSEHSRGDPAPYEDSSRSQAPA